MEKGRTEKKGVSVISCKCFMLLECGLKCCKNEQHCEHRYTLTFVDWKAGTVPLPATHREGTIAPSSLVMQDIEVKE